MALSDILLKLVVDSGDSNNKLHEIVSEINNIKNAVKEGGGIVNIFASSFKDALKEVTGLDKGLNNLSGTTNNYDNTVNKVNNSQKTINKTFEEGSQNIEKVSNSTKNYANTINTLETSIKGGVNALNTNNTAIQGNIKELNSQTTSVNAETTAIKTNTTAVETNNTTIQAQNVYIKQTIQAQKEATESTKTLHNIIWELYYAFRGLKEGIQLALSISFTEWSREFEKNLYNMQSIALETVEKFNYLKTSLIQISKDNNYSGLVGLSDALYQAYSSGFKLEGALNLVKEADRGALAGLANTKDVLEALVSVMHSYGMSTDQASHVNDIFLKTVQEGVITMPQLSRYIGQATTIAPELGIALEDVAAGYVAMTRQGLNAAESTTALNAVMKTFLDPSSEASKYATELGINLSKSAFEGHNFAQVIKEIAQKGDIDLLGKIFGNVRGLKGFFKLAKDDGDKFVQYIEDIKNATGTVDKAIEEQRKSFDQKVTQLKNTWEIFMQNIGETVQKILTPFIDVLISIIKIFNSLPEVIRTVIASLGILGSTIAGITLGVFSLNQALRALGMEALAFNSTLLLNETTIFRVGAALSSLQNITALLKTDLGILGSIAGLGAIAYGGFKTAEFLVDKGESDKTIDENSDVLANIKQSADTKISKYKLKQERGQKLTSLESGDYAKALMQSDPNNLANRELAKKLMVEYNLEIENQKKINDTKEKMNKETADKNMKIRQKFENEKTQGTIDNLIFEATHSEYEVKLNKKAKEYDEKIQLLRDHANLPHGVTEEQAQKDLEQAKQLEIAKQKELEKLRKEYAEKELEKARALAEKKSKLEYDKQQYDLKLKGQNYQENKAKLDFSKGDLTEPEYEQKLLKIDENRKKIYNDIANNSKLTKNVRDEASLKSIETEIKLETNLRKVKEETIKKDYDAIKEKNSLEMNNISHLAQIGKITKDEAYTREFQQLAIFKASLNELLKALPKNSKSITEIKKEIEKVNLDVSNKTDEQMKDKFEKEILQEQIKNQKIADDNEALYQLKQKNQEDYLKAKIDLIDDEIRIEQEKFDKANKDEQIKIQATIDKLNNKKELAKYNLEKSDNDIENKYQKTIFDEEKRQIQELKNLKVAGDLFVYRSSLDNINKYLSYLKTEKARLEQLGQGQNGSIGGKLGTEEWQNTNNQIKSLEAEKLQIIFDTDQKIIEEDRKLLQHRIENLNLYSLAFDKIGTSLIKSNNIFVSAMGESFKLLSTNYNDVTNFINKSEPLLNKITQNNKSTAFLKGSKLSNWSDWGSKSKQINANDEDTAIQKENIKNIGIGMAIEQVSKSLEAGVQAWDKSTEASKKYANVLKAFPADSKQAKEAQQGMIEGMEEWVKALPGVGDLLYKITRGISDFFGATQSEQSKKESKELSSSYITLAKTKINVDQVNLENKIKLLDLETETEKEKATESISNEEALKIELLRIDLEYNYKHQQMQEEFAEKSKEIQVNLNKSLRGLATESYEAKMEDIRTNAEKQLFDIAKKYNLPVDAPSYRKSTAQINEENTVRNNQRNQEAKLQIDANKQSLDIKYEYQKSVIELQEDSLSKTLALLNIEKKSKIDALNYENVTAKWTKEDYNEKYLTILNEFQGKENKAILDNNQKIRDINDKDYNLELKAVESLYGKKTNKIKSELDAQINIIDEYNRKVQELTQSREQDQELKTKRANVFAIDLANKKNSLSNNGAFFQSNWENFETGNGITQGNESERQKVENDYKNGLISFEERSKKRQQLALEKYVYYENQLSNFSDPEKRKEINSKMQDASTEYYEYIFDKEKEKLDIEKSNAEKKIETLKTELKQKEELEAAEIKKLDNAYKDSSGQYKNTFVQATKDWIDFAQKETIQKLGVDTFTTINQVGNDLIKNKDAAKKLGIGPTSTVGINNPEIANNVIKNNNEPINVTNVGNTNTTIANNGTSSSKNNNVNPSNPFTSKPKVNQNTQTPSNDIIFTEEEVNKKIQESNNLALRQKILNNIYNKLGGSYAYDKYDRLSTDDLIKFAKASDVPLMEKGGVTPDGQAVIAGEKKREYIFTESDAIKIHNELKNPASIHNNSASTIVFNIGDTVISGVNLADSSQFKSVVKEQFQVLTEKISNNLNKIK